MGEETAQSAELSFLRLDFYLKNSNWKLSS